MADEPVYEMFWDCKFCGSTKLLGKTHRHCPACGAAQDPSARYFPPEEEQVAVADHQYTGVDWRCGSCDTPNSNAAQFCSNCGAAKEGADSVKLVEESPEDVPVKEPSTSKGAMFGVIGLGMAAVAAVLCLGFVGAFFFMTGESAATVQGHQWARSIDIETYKAVTKEDWCDRVPSGTVPKTSTKKKRSTKKVQDGETCKTKRRDQGDGTFKTIEECQPKYRSEPVYDQWCTYNKDQWVRTKREQASGVGMSPPPRWPKSSVSNCRRLGCTREGKRVATYTLALTVDGSPTKCDVSEENWSSAKNSARCTIETRITGGVICNSLRCP